MFEFVTVLISLLLDFVFTTNRFGIAAVQHDLVSFVLFTTFSFLIAVFWATVLKGVIINKLSIKKMAEILFFIL